MTAVKKSFVKLLAFPLDIYFNSSVENFACKVSRKKEVHIEDPVSTTSVGCHVLGMRNEAVIEKFHSSLQQCQNSQESHMDDDDPY